MAIRTTLRATWASLGLLLLLAAPAAAQEPIPAVLPDIVFLVEDSAQMGEDWSGDTSLTNPDTRWVYARDAIKQVIQNAPLGMNFYVALTADGSFTGLAHAGQDTGDIIAALDAHTPSASGARTPAESLASLMDDWASVALPSEANRGWSYGPFQYDCNEMIVIVMGTDVGNQDSTPAVFDTIGNDVGCNDGSGQQACYLDNVAAYGYASFSAPFAGTGAVKTHAVVLDPNRGTIDPDTQPLFQSAANEGNGLLYAPTSPGGLATSIWSILTDSFEGSYSNARISMTQDGDMLFASYFEVEGGHPLYKGHLLAFQIQTDVTQSDYGLVVEQANSATGAGELWDAGHRLASRTVDADEDNQGNFQPLDARNGYTAAPNQDYYSAPLPFDKTEVAGQGTLADMLVDPVPLAANLACDPLDEDYDYDCDVDEDDAQILVDFIRGVPTSTFLHTGLSRGFWRLGDTGHSMAMPAMAEQNALASESHFANYLAKIGSLASIVYVASNAGMLHAFYVGPDTGDAAMNGSEYWFYVPRAKAMRDPAANYEFEGHQIDDLMRSGQTYVNDGQLVIDNVWLDGYHNGLPGCSDGWQGSSEADGVINTDGCEWHRIVVWAGGYGSRHVYALDVTNPAEPKFLWERTDDGGTTSSAGGGRAVSSPSVASFVDAAVTAKRRWVVVWGAGSQQPGVGSTSPNSERAHAAIYIHDMDTTATRVPTDYSKGGYAAPIPTSLGTDTDSDGYREYPTTTEGLFGSPALADLDGDGSVDVGYVGDSEGYVYKILFQPGAPSTPSICRFSAPDLDDDAKHVFYRPSVFYSQGGDLLVYYASGSPFNVYDEGTGGLYVKLDPSPFQCNAGVAAPCASATTDVNGNGFRIFDGAGEKTVGEAVVASSRIFFTTHVPNATDACDIGTSRLYGLGVNTCEGGLPTITGAPEQPVDNEYFEVAGVASAPVFANGRLYSVAVDGAGLDADSVLDQLQVTPDSATGQTNFTSVSWRHIF